MPSDLKDPVSSSDEDCEQPLNKQQQQEEVEEGPVDRWNSGYIIFYCLGIGTLLPWNFFISVSEYWRYKWRDVEDKLFIDDYSFNKATSTKVVDIGSNEMQTNWNSHLSVASMIPNVTFLMLNAIIGHHIPVKPRILISLVIVVTIFTFSDTMTLVNTDSFQSAFYVSTLCSVVLINVCVAIFQGGVIGVAGAFPPKYIGGVFSGQALGGIFSSCTNIFFLMLGCDIVLAAFYDFLIAILFLVFSIVSFVWLTRTPFFKHYAAAAKTSPTTHKVNNNKGLSTTDNNDSALLTSSPSYDESNNNTPPPQLGDESSLPDVVVCRNPNPMLIARKIWHYLLSVLLIFTVSLACFPSITVLIVSKDRDNGSQWSSTYFIPVACFLIFNVGDYVGRSIAELVKSPKPSHSRSLSSWSLILICVGRVIFVPLFIMCNANPHSRTYFDVTFESDSVYVVLMILFSLSNGYLCNVCMMNAPQIVSPQERQTAASLMVAFLGLGLCLGSVLSNFCVKLV